MKWIDRNVPSGELIAGRLHFEHNEVLGQDATTWLPYFTRHQTNQTNLAAAMEKAPPDRRKKLRVFSQELGERDMSTPESARWMLEEGFGWFYAGAIQPEWEVTLLEQIAHNPALELVRTDNGARLYRVK
jgi:hypothetical protein